MSDYTNNEFWTEGRCIEQRKCFLNVLLHPEKFPKADDKALWAEVAAIEEHLANFASVRVLRELTGQS